MKTFITTCTFIFYFLCVAAQPTQHLLSDTLLREQKENVITASTIIQVENLGEDINTFHPEMRPTISADGNLLFFIRQNDPANIQYATVPNSQDIWYSTRDSLGNWSKAKHLSAKVNASQYNAVYWISPDLNTILLKGAFIDGQYLGMGVSMIKKRKDNSWTNAEMLKIRKLEKFSTTPQFGASMGHNGKVLLFYMTDKKGSFDNDIYVSFLEGNDIWTAPKSLGKKINLPDYNEMSPFIAADGVTLYFASDRPGGIGEMDIWMSKRLDDSWTKWSDPVNVGKPINTEGSEAFFTLDAGGEYAYLTTSNGAYGASDIVRVKLLEKVMPNPVVLVTGNVYNAKTKEPLSASLVYETLPDGTEVGTGVSSPVDGSFKIVLPYDKNYSIRAAADKFFAISENLNLDSLIKAGYKVIHKDLYLAPIEIGQVFRLNNVFFDFDKYSLRPESFVELDRVVNFLNEYPNIEIEMSAHTDSKGADEYNMVLSDNRARSVMEYILSKGIAASRIVSHGYGETKPVAPNTNPDGSDNPDGRQLNRRVEFKILKN
ncbi:MAG: OmpA family protein [Ferruginibacter sp.]|nr:OmpA family protein [Bacteroidota bacterium]MBX2920091.1 OmpA family protein [Ferruginibacter sp.]MCB0710637.1 OmpA family protein [Chitinophagaceae bacterium]MCC7377818.1 OmpA family protein [Chitinophagaceae bacterium]